MLYLTVEANKGREFYNETTNEFIQKDGNDKTVLCLEHSLLSISKWESKWHKPFISKDNRTEEEQLDYIKCMCITQNVNPNVFLNLSNENIKTINEYINNPMTASTILDIKEKSAKKKSEKWITSELIYYWMIGLQIPFECEKWHLNRLLMLIRICDVKSNSNNKLSKADTLRRQRALNEARKAKLHSKG